jgi:hypothetical protein
MNRFESDQWAKSAKLQLMNDLEKNGSGISRSIKAVLNHCSLSVNARQELDVCLRREEEEVLRYLKDNGL